MARDVLGFYNERNALYQVVVIAYISCYGVRPSTMLLSCTNGKLTKMPVQTHRLNGQLVAKHAAPPSTLPW